MIMKASAGSSHGLWHELSSIVARNVSVACDASKASCRSSPESFGAGDGDKQPQQDDAKILDPADGIDSKVV
ncbi:hypothetical protein NKI79_16270 [Mesorhizobium sp. M0340]|uniref:hypothetical protein n=1 Tax=Mesorhizobium sp. M0340 TaxID=2956939 RepID=UPI0033394DA6